MPTPPAGDSAVEILRTAETLRIPWKRVLLEEIEAEQKLQRYFADIQQECPLRSILRLLPSSFLRSWRARDQIEHLAAQARADSTRDALNQLKIVFSELIGKSVDEKAAFSEHLWFAYQRILLLQRVRRTAARSRGTVPERLAFICSNAHCSYDDAAWAMQEEGSSRYGDRFDAAVRKVREEGFRIPRAETEARSLAELRRIARASPHLRRERASRRSSLKPSDIPRRVELPADAS